MADIKNQSAEPKKSGSNKGLLIAFIIILAAINGLQLFFNISQKKTIETQTVTIAEKNTKIESMTAELDSLISELEARKAQITSLEGDTTTLYNQIRELEVAKRNLQNVNGNWQKKYNDAIAVRDAAVRVRQDSDKELDRLKYMLAQQDTTITKQKTVIVQREDSIRKISSEKNQLAEKVAIASVLRADKFEVQALTSKGKADTDGQFKAKKIDIVKITFVLAENKVADKGGRDIYFRLIEPGGGALFDLANGGGSFQNEGKEVFYTMKQTVLFENKGQKINYEYKKGSTYKSGSYKIEIYCDGFKIGESTFLVK